jgi:hypothetical protein
LVFGSRKLFKRHFCICSEYGEGAASQVLEVLLRESGGRRERCIKMYYRDATETSKGALVELCRALRQYRSDMVLSGGWAPYFMVKDYFGHCGSIDIDFVLKPKVIERYEKRVSSRFWRG